MKNHPKAPAQGGGFPNYGRTLISGLKKSRKGKHHDLLFKIMEDLRNSQSGLAVTVPLASIDGVSVLNLRSAIVRAASKEKIHVATASDTDHFYVWKA
ncbi:MAG TPA: hypothetical protein VJQ54_01850 [Candidatus Sulfotelmatobacter sp.]|nr:hypothetical protein [Candidatus Sulfotelmatobacter sp.]